GCTTTESFTINEPDVVVVPGGQLTLVYTYGDLATPLTATALPGHTLQWYDSATGGTADSQAPTPTTSVVGIQQYWVSQRTATGCESARVALEVKVEQAPLYVVVDQDQTKAYGDTDPTLTYEVTGLQNGDQA